MKTTKIISLNSNQEILDKQADEYYEQEGYDFEGWEEEGEYIDNEDWDGLLEYYQKKLENGQKDYCLKISGVYINELKQYQKAIDFLLPIQQENPREKAIGQEIGKARNYLENKEIKLQRKDFRLMGEDDMFRLFFDELRTGKRKKFSERIDELYKKYDYLSVDINDNIYGVNNGKKDLLHNEPEAYSIANDLID